MRGTCWRCAPQAGEAVARDIAGPRRAPALTAVTGSLLAMAVAASGAAAFHQSVSWNDAPPPFHFDIHLESVHDGYPQVYARVAVTHSDGPVYLGGGIAYGAPPYAARGGMLVYEGLLDTVAPVYAGDTIHVVVHHPSGRHVQVAEVR